MPAHKTKLLIDQGADFEKAFLVKDYLGAAIDFTGCTGEAQIRSEIDSPTVLLLMTTANGRITFGGPNGLLTISLDSATTDSLSFDTGVFDLEVTFPGGRKDRILAGSVRVSPAVTR